MSTEPTHAEHFCGFQNVLTLWRAISPRTPESESWREGPAAPQTTLTRQLCSVTEGGPWVSLTFIACFSVWPCWRRVCPGRLGQRESSAHLGVGTALRARRGHGPGPGPASEKPRLMVWPSCAVDREEQLTGPKTLEANSWSSGCALSPTSDTLLTGRSRHPPASRRLPPRWPRA